MTPDQAYDLIHAHAISIKQLKLDIDNAHTEDELAKFDANMQNYYNKMVELHKQLLDSVPSSAPNWAYACASRAWSSVVRDALDWEQIVKRNKAMRARREEKK